MVINKTRGSEKGPNIESLRAHISLKPEGWTCVKTTQYVRTFEGNKLVHFYRYLCNNFKAWYICKDKISRKVEFFSRSAARSNFGSRISVIITLNSSCTIRYRSVLRWVLTLYAVQVVRHFPAVHVQRIRRAYISLVLLMQLLKRKRKTKKH